MHSAYEQISNCCEYDMKSWKVYLEGSKTEVQCKFCTTKVMTLKSHMIRHAESATYIGRIVQENRTESQSQNKGKISQ